MTDQEDSKYYSLGEASKILEISDQTLRRWAKKGRVPHLLKPSGHFLFLREDIDTFYTKRKAILKKS